MKKTAMLHRSRLLPLLRILTVPYGKNGRMRESFPRLHEWSDWFKRHFRKGDWDVCSPEVARELSAIGYAFARRLRTLAMHFCSPPLLCCTSRPDFPHPVLACACFLAFSCFHVRGFVL